ncbi:UNVERIFIED_CONTAM: hypothetical protein Slati_4429200 [Sesamum latifolium]|uniref:Uncharacterized protein n=1 Tax=Sesamum latifolium TaxID=2727402 RepID=A0AAW2SQ68_9LAMI
MKMNMIFGYILDLDGPLELYGAKSYNVIIIMVMWYSGIRYGTPLGATSKVHMSIQEARGWTVREACWGSIGLPVEASLFSSHLGVLSQAGCRLSACDTLNKSGFGWPKKKINLDCASRIGPREGVILLGRDTSSEEPQHDNTTSFEPPVLTDSVPVLRRSTREFRTPERYRFVGWTSQLDNDPKTYGEAISNIDSDKWLEAMKSKMDSMGSNQVWILVDPSKGVRPVRCK